MLRKHVVVLDNPVCPAYPFMQTNDSLMRWTPVFDESVRLHDSESECQFIAERLREWGRVSGIRQYQTARVQTLTFDDNV